MDDSFETFTQGMTDGVDRYLEAVERDGVHHWLKSSETWSAYKEGVHDAVAVVTAALIELKKKQDAEPDTGPPASPWERGES